MTKRTNSVAMAARRQMREGIVSLAVEGIMAEVARQRDLSVRKMTERSRARELVYARQEVMYRATCETTASSLLIARLLGLRDHTTVLFGAKAHAGRIMRRVSCETTNIVDNSERTTKGNDNGAHQIG